MTTTSSMRLTCWTGRHFCWITYPTNPPGDRQSRRTGFAAGSVTRARELVEVRAADLRFTPEEAATYLNGVMGLGLAATDVRALEGRTEGWIAALQLAVLSMRGRDESRGSSPASRGTIATSSTIWSRSLGDSNP